jgi:hypothetical protein
MLGILKSSLDLQRVMFISSEIAKTHKARSHAMFPHKYRGHPLLHRTDCAEQSGFSLPSSPQGGHHGSTSFWGPNPEFPGICGLRSRYRRLGWGGMGHVPITLSQRHRCRRCRRRRFISHLADKFVPWHQQWTCVCFLCAMETEVGRQVKAHFRLRQSCRQTRDSCALKQIRLEIRCSKDNYISYKMLQVVEYASGGFQEFMFSLCVLACPTIVSWPTFGVEKHLFILILVFSSF